MPLDVQTWPLFSTVIAAFLFEIRGSENPFSRLVTLPLQICGLLVRACITSNVKSTMSCQIANEFQVRVFSTDASLQMFTLHLTSVIQ